MTYKVPYMTVKMIYIHNCDTQKMLVSSSDFRVKLEMTSNSYLIGRVLWEELLVLSRFHS